MSIEYWDRVNAWNKTVAEAGEKAGHKPTYKETPAMCDHYECSCGWKSPGYYDGALYAWRDWIKHARHNDVALPDFNQSVA